MLHQDETNESLRFIRCGIGEEAYGLEMSWVRRIQRTDRLRHNREEAGSQIGQRRDPVAPPGDEPVGWAGAGSARRYAANCRVLPLQEVRTGRGAQVGSPG